MLHLYPVSGVLRAAWVPADFGPLCSIQLAPHMVADRVRVRDWDRVGHMVEDRVRVRDRVRGGDGDRLGHMVEDGVRVRGGDRIGHMVADH